MRRWRAAVVIAIAAMAWSDLAAAQPEQSAQAAQASGVQGLGDARFDGAIGVICAPLQTRITVYESVDTPVGAEREASLFDYPMPVFETRRFRLRVLDGDKQVWVRYRQFSWRLLSSPFGEVSDAGTSRGFGSQEQRGAEIHELCQSSR